jgi:GT2 family glycosyltransferase
VSFVDETLASIFKHSNALIVIHVILVADGDPNAEVSSVVLRHAQLHPQDITFLIRPHKGYTFAVNAAIKEFQRRAVASFVVILNSDVVVTKGWLRKMVATAMSGESIGAVGPLSNAAYTQSVPDIYVGNGTTEMNFNYLKEDWTVDGMAELVESMSLRLYPSFRILNGFCILFKAHVFSRVGFFDEEHFGPGYGEENDYAIRMTSAGFTLVVDDATWIYHLKSKSFGHEVRKSLSTSAHQALRKKYSDKVINEVMTELHANSQIFDPLRSALHTALASPLFKDRLRHLSPQDTTCCQ